MKMKMRHVVSTAVLAAVLTLPGVAGANGGCLQGTWHYFDVSGRLVGEQTVGCGELDGSWGSITANSGFSQGCASSD